MMAALLGRPGSQNIPGPDEEVAAPLGRDHRDEGSAELSDLL
jgi:hypothetical protein